MAVIVLINTYAPTKRKEITIHADIAWTNDSTEDAKCKRQKAERKSRLTVYYDIYVNTCEKVTSPI